MEAASRMHSWKAWWPYESKRTLTRAQRRGESFIARVGRSGSGDSWGLKCVYAYICLTQGMDWGHQRERSYLILYTCFMLCRNCKPWMWTALMWLCLHFRYWLKVIWTYLSPVLFASMQCMRAAYYNDYYHYCMYNYILYIYTHVARLGIKPGNDCKTIQAMFIAVHCQWMMVHHATLCNMHKSLDDPLAMCKLQSWKAMRLLFVTLIMSLLTVAHRHPGLGRICLITWLPKCI